MTEISTFPLAQAQKGRHLVDAKHPLMAIAAQYSYRYRLRWGPLPTVVMAEEFGVGLDPEVSLDGGVLILKAREAKRFAFPSLSLPLVSAGLPVQEHDIIDWRCTPLNGHRSLSWWRYGELQAHLGQLTTLSGERLGNSVCEIVNEYDVDECLALYQRQWAQRLGAGQSSQLGDYQVQLDSLGGLVTGRSYRAEGWLGRRNYAPQELKLWTARLTAAVSD
jgi:hypothetical protein